MTSQPAILLPPPPAARYLAARLSSPDAAGTVLDALAAVSLGEELCVGLGEPLVRARGAAVPGLRGFPARGGPGVALP
ncbi:MAG: peroxidase, partial [Myxococcota bacterium]